MTLRPTTSSSTTGAGRTWCHARPKSRRPSRGAAFNVANALAAVAVCHGLGVKADRIGSSPRSFASSFEQNPGRLNIHDGHGFKVILDYAHNPEGLRALGRLVQAMRPATGRIIGMVSIPGDRREEEIRAMGEIAAEYFDSIVFRETPDNRGRPVGRSIAFCARVPIARPSADWASTLWSRSTSTSAPKAGMLTRSPPSRTPRESSSPAATSSAYTAKLETLR